MMAMLLKECHFVIWLLDRSYRMVCLSIRGNRNLNSHCDRNGGKSKVFCL